MPRIRNVKPELFRHEILNELGPLAMIVFVGLMTQADKNGVFLISPKQLKLDILPFHDYDLVKVLTDLENAGMFERFSHDGKEYGFIASFPKHQTFATSECKAPARFPAPELGSNGRKHSEKVRLESDASQTEVRRTSDLSQREIGNRKKEIGNRNSEIGNRKKEYALPETLATVPGFSDAFQAWLSLRSSLSLSSSSKFLSAILDKLSARPKDATSAMEMATAKSWKNFDWAWFDKARPTQEEHPPAGKPRRWTPPIDRFAAKMADPSWAAKHHERMQNEPEYAQRHHDEREQFRKLSEYVHEQIRLEEQEMRT